MRKKKILNIFKKIITNIKIYATVHVKDASCKKTYNKKILALGQKSSLFTGSNNFVNIIEGGGMYGFSSIVKLCDLMIDAFLKKRHEEINTI